MKSTIKPSEPNVTVTMSLRQARLLKFMGEWPCTVAEIVIAKQEAINTRGLVLDGEQVQDGELSSAIESLWFALNETIVKYDKGEGINVLDQR